MIRALHHRGPDDTGFYVDEGIGLANARLSIIDLEGGHQPMDNEDGTVDVTYNGEIYNFRDLRKDLASAGHRFRTHSDTEVIVHSYEAYGEDFASRLNGMFAIALWDSKARKLILARDRMGIKPLYYTVQQGALLFASEIKAILQAPIARTVDREALYAVLNVGYVPGDRTLLNGVRKLPPSGLLVFQEGKVRTSTYWELPAIDSRVEESLVIRKLRSALEESVRDQLVADVPLGCFLSGGLDTSTIVCLASKSTNRPLKTFCMGFGEETDEFADARIVANHFGTDHEELTVDSSQAMKLYPQMIWHMEVPKYNLYPWFVCELVRKHVKVCLSGNGGDEVFGGYFARYQYAVRIGKLSKSPLASLLRGAGEIAQPLVADLRVKNRFRVLSALGRGGQAYCVLAGAFPDSFNVSLFRDGSPTAKLTDYYDAYFKTSDFMQGLMNAELRTKLVDDLLSVDDTMSMAHSLELRVPLLDNRIVDLMTTIPWQMKYHRGTYGKILLRQAVSDLLPQESLRKPKWGFSVDVSSWFRGELGELVKQIIPESEVIKAYFKQKTVQRLIDRPFSTSDRRYHALLWQLLGFHFWHRIFIDSDQVGMSNLEINALVA